METTQADTLPLDTLSAEPEVKRRPYLTIRPSRGWIGLDLREIWQFRDLLESLALRDLKLRYKQTILGVLWVVLVPLMAAGVFSFVFGTVAKLPSGKVPYLVFSFAGLLGWSYFAGVLTKISGCLLGNSNLISKVFFPRLILPLATIGSNLVDFLVSAVVMTVLLVIYHVVPSPAVLLLPVWMAILTAIALGLGLSTAALAVSYRDIPYIIPVFTQILLYASPVAYSVSAVPERLRWVYSLNPLTPPLEAMRASLLGTALPATQSLLLSAGLALCILLTGLFSFKRMESKFADVI
ncbi:MAG TPA: ABC transporter permease [Chthoniobacteraceae bacterium]|jgi:lipopolysaccharide transport system permease protein|nr:ABC transporter permease [Chthoniobacteraceae bacterium]